MNRLSLASMLALTLCCASCSTTRTKEVAQSFPAASVAPLSRLDGVYENIEAGKGVFPLWEFLGPKNKEIPSTKSDLVRLRVGGRRTLRVELLRGNQVVAAEKYSFRNRKNHVDLGSKLDSKLSLDGVGYGTFRNLLTRSGNEIIIQSKMKAFAIVFFIMPAGGKPNSSAATAGSARSRRRLLPFPLRKTVTSTRRGHLLCRLSDLLHPSPGVIGNRNQNRASTRATSVLPHDC